MATEASTISVIGVKFVIPDFGGNPAAVDNTVLQDFLQRVSGSSNADQLVTKTEIHPQTGETVYQTEHGNFVTFDTHFAPKTINLSADSSQAVVSTGHNTKVIGSGGNDNVMGVADNNLTKFKLGAGDDTLTLTGQGNFTAKMGVGNDTVDIASTGNVVATGGKGADTFIIEASAGGRQVITDFSKQDQLVIADRTGDNKVDSNDILNVKAAGDNTVIILKGGDKIILEHVQKSSLNDLKDQLSGDGVHHEGVFTLH